MTELSEIAREFGVRLRAARGIRGLTQAELAAAVSLPAASISHFESGRRMPCLTNLASLAYALEADANWLLCLCPEPAPHLVSTRLARDIDGMAARDRQVLTQMVEVLRDTAAGHGEGGRG